MYKFKYYSIFRFLKFKARLILFILFISGSNELHATHATGADLTYHSLGNGVYRMTFTLYRDCFGISAPFSQMLYFSSASCNIINEAEMFRVPGTGIEITHPCSAAASTCQGGSVAGIQEWKYVVDISLPVRCTDWHFFTSVANRNAAITTIINPDNYALYVEAFLNNTTGENNSPTFSNAPIAFECIGQTNNFNQGVIDADGDSLVYSFITPRKDGITNLIYKSGYSVTNPIVSSPPVSINSINGDITMSPVQSDIASVAVLIKEYRNGILIGSVMRDMQLYIVGCSNTLPEITGINGTRNFTLPACAGQQICFDVFSKDLDQNQVLTMSWSQSIPGATFVTTGTRHPVGHFCWSPSTANERDQPYTFSVTIRDNACPSNGIQTFSYSILVSKLNIQLTATPIVQCFGSHNGSAVATATGNMPLQYIWTFPNGNILTTKAISHLKAGNYSLNVIDGSGCLKTKFFTIAEPPALKVAITPTNGNCINNMGTAIANVSGGSPAYNYLWLPGGQSTSNAINLLSNTYSVKITDAKGCTTTASTNIQNITPVIFELVLTGATCVNNDGSATVNHTGGSGNFTYEWTPDIPGNNTTSSLTGLVTGFYSVIATDIETGCSQTLSGIVQNLAGISATITSTTNARCESDENGSATLTASGGELPYFYSWPNGDNTSTTNHLAPGLNLAMVEDYNGCRAFAIAQIGFDFPSPIINLGSDTSACINAPYLIEAGQGFETYLWNSGQTGSSIIATNSGMYSVLVTNTKGCQSFDTININFVSCSITNNPQTSNSKSIINIYPNPTNSEINISISRIRNTEVTLTVTDILGNKIFISRETSGYGYTKKVDLQSFPAGIYLVRAEYDGEINTVRILKH